MTAWNDERLERIISIMLRSGVLLSAAIVLSGGAFYLIRNGGERAAFHAFQAAAPSYRSAHAIAIRAFQLDAGAIIQFGLLLLILTPVARVAFSIVAFVLERDRTYAAISLIVLSILVYSLMSAR